MQTAFVPDAENLAKLKQLLKDIHVGNDALQKKVTKELGVISDHKDFPLYCCAILKSNEDLTLRYTAGICLKSVLGRSQPWTASESERNTYIEDCLYACFEDASDLIRKAAKLSIVTIVNRNGIVNSSRSLAFLVKCIKSNTSFGNVSLISEAIDTLALVFQDINFNSENVEDPDKIYGSPFVNELISKLIAQIEPGVSNTIRVPAFDCLTNLLVASPPELIAKTQDLVKGMLAIIEDPEPKIRQRIYSYFLTLCQIRKDLFVSQSNEIFPKLTVCLRDPDPAAKRVCFMVFWEYLSFHDTEESSQVIQLLIPYLDSLLPALLENSLLTEEDKENLISTVSNYIEKSNLYEKGMSEGCDEEHFELDEEDGEDEADINGAYTLRKIAIRCIVKIFEFLGNPAFSFVKGGLDIMMQSQDPIKQEAAICIFGSVGNHCFDEIKGSLGVILKFILNCCDSNNQFLKSTSIWTICKFRNHLLNDQSDHTKKFLIEYLGKILTTIQGNSVVAQDSASTALKKLCASKSDFIVDFHPALLELFVTVLSSHSYHKVFVYDILAEFVESITEPEFQREVMAKVLPLLGAHFEAVNIQDGSFIPLFECLCSIVRTVQDKSYLPLVEPILNRVVFLSKEISKVLIQGKEIRHKSKDRVKMEYELNNNLMRCFDFISSLADSTEGEFARFPIVREIPDIVFAHFYTDNSFLIQIVFSLFGDLVSYCDPQLLEPKIDEAVKVLLQHCKIIPESIDPGRTYLSTATNSLYSLSEIVIKFPNHINPKETLAKLLNIFENRSKMHKFMALNCAILYGRLGIFYPDDCAKCLKECLKKVCFGFICSNTEGKSKHDSFIGINKIILKNPVDFLVHAGFYLEAVGKFQQPTPEVTEGIKMILNELIKGDQAVRAKVEEAYKGLSQEAKAGLKNNFHFPPN